MKQIEKKHQTKSSLELARLAGRAALDKKAEDIIILDVRGISSFTDYFVIMSGRSTRHVQGLADAVERQVEREFSEQARLAKTRDHAEGIKAVTERRAGHFTRS